MNTRQGRERRPHIGIFGRCNSGKSSLLNFILGSDAAIVAPEAGTTTDTVSRACELRGAGPVVLVDTAGVDDRSLLGAKRVARTLQAADRADMALLVYTAWGDPERVLARRFADAGLPVVLVHNIRGDAAACAPGPEPEWTADQTRVVLAELDVSSGSSEQRDRLLDGIARLLPVGQPDAMFAGRVVRGDVVILVCPVDSGAPAGRLILPQVQALRELLDLHAAAVVVQPDTLAAALRRNPDARMVVADSQALAAASAIVPPHIELTSFSILLAAAKGDAELYARSLAAVDTLGDGDRVLIAESCSHQASCEDIGRVKIPRWLEKYTGKHLEFTIVSGHDPLPDDLSRYSLAVQCGACMITRAQLSARLRQAREAGLPVTNYGMLIRKITAVKH